MIHSIFILLFSLLMMHQQVAKLNSSYVLPNWLENSLPSIGKKMQNRIKISASFIIYIGLWTNGIVSILTSGDVPKAQEIIEVRSTNFSIFIVTDSATATHLAERL